MQLRPRTNVRNKWRNLTTTTSILSKFSFTSKFEIPWRLAETIATNCVTKERAQHILVVVVIYFIEQISLSTIEPCSMQADLVSDRYHMSVPVA